VLPRNKSDLPSFAQSLLNDETDFSRWLATALLNSFMLFQNPFFHQHIGEIGYACIWTRVLDIVLVNSGWYISRGEQESMSEKDFWKKFGLALSLDIRSSPKYDGILKGYHEIDVTEDAEYGYTEVAKDKQAAHSTKREDDEGKMMRAMRFSLMESKDMAQDVWLKQYRVSVFCSGLQMRIIYMTPGNGSVFLVRRRSIVNLPKDYNGDGLHRVLQEIAYFRALVMGDGFVIGSLDGTLDDF